MVEALCLSTLSMNGTERGGAMAQPISQGPGAHASSPTARASTVKTTKCQGTAYGLQGLEVSRQPRRPEAPWPERKREKTSRVGPLPQLSCNPRPRILLQASAVRASGSGFFSGVSARIQLATRHSLPLERVFPWWDGRFLISYPLKVEQFPQSLLWHLWYFFFPMPTNVRTHTSQVPLC